MKVVLVIACSLLLASFCTTLPSKLSEKDEIIEISRKENRKYNLTAVFYGQNHNYGENNDLTAKIIRYIIFRRNDSGEEVRYYPKEDETEQHATFYFTEIWSPDEEYLVLPIGRFDGFGIIKSNETMKAVKNNDFFDTIRVFNVYEYDNKNNRLTLWHNFKGWNNSSSVIFDAGLSGNSDNYQYDFIKQILTTSPDKVRNTIKGENVKGEIPLKSNSSL